jgi:hypothetical protein
MVTDKETQEKRKQICSDCEKRKLGICTKCGCIIEMKIRWEISSCPIGKW